MFSPMSVCVLCNPADEPTNTQTTEWISTKLRWRTDLSQENHFCVCVCVFLNILIYFSGNAWMLMKRIRHT